MPIVAFLGDFGSGKTLLMTKRGYRHYLQGRKVFANYGLKFPHERLNLKRLLAMGEDLKNCVILIDEAHVLMDSYEGTGKLPMLLSYFITQTRKRGVTLMFATQDEMQVHVRLRRFVDDWVYPRKVNKKNKDDDRFRYKRWNRRGKYMGERQFRGTPIYKLYDTEEAITDFQHKIKGVLGD